MDLKFHPLQRLDALGFQQNICKKYRLDDLRMLCWSRTLIAKISGNLHAEATTGLLNSVQNSQQSVIHSNTVPWKLANANSSMHVARKLTRTKDGWLAKKGELPNKKYYSLPTFQAFDGWFYAYRSRQIKNKTEQHLLKIYEKLSFLQLSNIIGLKFCSYRWTQKIS